MGDKLPTYTFQKRSFKTKFSLLKKDWIGVFLPHAYKTQKGDFKVTAIDLIDIRTYLSIRQRREHKFIPIFVAINKLKNVVENGQDIDEFLNDLRKGSD